jgi:pimeloyl-ACP methyl ester carboxylesterase
MPSSELQLRPPTRQDELREAGRLAADAVGWLAGAIGEVHGGIADRAFGATGPAATPVRRVHDRVSRTVYDAVGSGLRSGVRAAGAVSALVTEERTPLAEGPAGAQATAILNAYVGDRLERAGSPLAMPMTIRVDGRAVPPTREALREAFPQATDHVVVFLHGLGETEHGWLLGAERWHGDPRSTHGTRLLRDLRATPVEIRMNTGLRIPENGRRLAALLEALVAVWPVPVHVVDLVGHSMGGLVCRSAAHDRSRAWTVLLRHVCCLGSPHAGAPLEKGVNAAAHGLARIAELRPVAQAINLRSAGIKDLRHGSAHDDDWRDLDVDGWLAGRCGDLELPPQARCHVLSASVHRDPEHLLSRALGDLLVRHASAQGTGLPFERRAHAGAVNHFALLNHPVAYAWLRACLGDPPQLERRTGV